MMETGRREEREEKNIRLTHLQSSSGSAVGKKPPASAGVWVRSLGQEDPLEEEMATSSSILAWKLPWTEDPGGLQSMGSKKV